MAVVELPDRAAGATRWRRPTAPARSLAVIAVVGGLLCLAGLVHPPAGEGPATLDIAGALTAPPLLALLLWPTRALRTARTHVAAGITGALALTMVASSATGEGAVAISLTLIWLAVHAASFHTRAVARSYQLLIAAGLLVAMSANPVLLAPWATWLVVTASAVAGAEVLGRMLGAIRHAAITDPLTGLPTRVVLHEHFTALRHARARAALVLIDLDGFKAVNDEFGHLAGDRHLIAACDALREGLGAGTTLIRLGGDELVALLPATDAVMADSRLAVLQRTAGTPFSYGVADISGPDVDLDGCLSLADHRMYAQKQSRRSRQLSLA